MLNVIEMQEALRDYSQDQLANEMQSPSGQVPQYLVLSEMQRRKRMRDSAVMNDTSTSATVAEEMVAASGIPSLAAGQMAQSLAPKTDMNMNTGRQPMPDMMASEQPVQMMQEGGPVMLNRSIYGGPDTTRQALERERLRTYLAEAAGDMDPRRERLRDYNVRMFDAPPAPTPPMMSAPIEPNPSPAMRNYFSTGMSDPRAQMATPQDLPVMGPQNVDRARLEQMANDMSNPNQDWAINQIRLAELGGAGAASNMMFGDMGSASINNVEVPTEAQLADDAFRRGLRGYTSRVENVQDRIDTLQDYLAMNPDDAGATAQLEAAQASLVGAQAELQGQLSSGPSLPAPMSAAGFVDMPPAPDATAAPEETVDGLSFGLPAVDANNGFPTYDGLAFGVPIEDIEKEIDQASEKVANLVEQTAPSGGVAVTDNGQVNVGGGGGGGGASVTAAVSGPASGMSSAEQILMARMQDLEAQRDEAKWMSLANFGLSLMASNTGNFGTDIGIAGGAALENYQSSLTQLQDDEDALLDVQLQLAIARDEQEAAARIASIRAAGSRSSGGGGGRGGGSVSDGRVMPTDLSTGSKRLLDELSLSARLQYEAAQEDYERAASSDSVLLEPDMVAEAAQRRDAALRNYVETRRTFTDVVLGAGQDVSDDDLNVNDSLN